MPLSLNIMPADKESTRKTPRSIEATLIKAAQEGRFLSVRVNKDNKWSVSKVYITGRAGMWKKERGFTYSFGTRLAGHPEDILEYLRALSADKDDTAERVITLYNEDFARGSVATVDNQDDTGAIASFIGIDGKRVRGASVAELIAHENSHREGARKEAGVRAKAEKQNMLSPYDLPELVRAYHQAQGDAPTARRASGRAAHAKKVTELLNRIAEDKSLYFSVSNFTAEGLKPRKVAKENIPKTAVHLAESGELHHFFVSPDKRAGLINFMTLYHVQGGHSVTEALTEAKAVANQLTPARRGTGVRRSRSKSSTRSRSGSKKRARKSRAKSTSKSSSGSSKKSTRKSTAKKTAPKAKPAGKRAPATRRRSPSKSKSPKRTSPRSTSSTSPDNAAKSPRRTRAASKSPSRSPRSTSPRTRAPARLTRPPKTAAK